MTHVRLLSVLINQMKPFRLTVDKIRLNADSNYHLTCRCFIMASFEKKWMAPVRKFRFRCRVRNKDYLSLSPITKLKTHPNRIIVCQW